MTAGVSSFISDVFDPVRLIGPIFDKELRVSSRRRRSYLLRFAYVAVLGVFVLSVWYSVFGVQGSNLPVYMVSRLSLTATLLAGALSLLLSMTYRHAYTVILVTLMVYMVLFGALSGLFNMLAVKGMFIFDRQVTQSLFLYGSISQRRTVVVLWHDNCSLLDYWGSRFGFCAVCPVPGET